MHGLSGTGSKRWRGKGGVGVVYRLRNEILGQERATS
jgi:hypothetical protein